MVIHFFQPPPPQQNLNLVVDMVRTLYVVYLAVFSCVLAGKTHSDHFVHCCCLSLWKQVNIWLYLPHALMDFSQSWVRCNMGTLICWCSQRSHIKVKGHLRSSCKIAENVKVASLEKMSPIETKLGLLILWEPSLIFMQSKVIYQGQRSSEVK